jgi:hypothetical protein
MKIQLSALAFYLEQDTPPSSSEDPNASSAPTVRWRPPLLEVAKSEDFVPLGPDSLNIDRAISWMHSVGQDG